MLRMILLRRTPGVFEMLNRTTIFRDRVDAGRRLADRLVHLKPESPLILALPRGGVVVGAEVAEVLQAPLDIIAVRKIGAPYHPEFGIGAMVDGDSPEILLDQESMRITGTTREALQAQIDRELLEIHRREKLYRGDRRRIPVAGRTVIVVDDGIATGSTIRAALRAMRRAGPRKLILAAPVAPPATVESLRQECDDVVCLSCPLNFRAVGEAYEDFSQTTDAEVIALLEQHGDERTGGLTFATHSSPASTKR